MTIMDLMMTEEEKKEIQIVSDEQKVTETGTISESEDREEDKSTVSDPVKELEIQLDTAKKEAKENYDRFLRSAAEFENYKRRTTREMDSFRKFAYESVIKELLPVVDNLERAIQSTAQSDSNNACIMQGVELTLKELLRIFEKFAVKPVEALGQPFNPAFHEAVMQEENDEYPENTVIRELQKGYAMHERLIRASIVLISKAKPKTEQMINQEESCQPA